MVFRCDGHQWAGPTQMLPSSNTVSSEQAAAGLKTFSATLLKEGAIPSTAGKKVKLSSGAFSWTEYRVATKNVLVAIANSLAHSMGPAFNMKRCQPPNTLRGAGITGERLELVEIEKAALGILEKKGPCMYIYDYKTHECALDFYLHESFVRLVFAADEGTEEHGQNILSVLFLEFLCFLVSCPWSRDSSSSCI